MAVITVFGIVGALLFFGYNIRRIMQLLPAILGVAFFAFSLPITINVMMAKKTTYESRADPKKAGITRVDVKRLSPQTVEISVSLSAPARVVIQYKGPGRDFIIPITPVGGSAARDFHVFNLPKIDTAPGIIIFDVEGEERLFNNNPVMVY
ncbi:MAG: hypothetical protein Q7S14_01865 [bacterium]|nr:hypothetical protein [bacterium]